MTQEEIQDRNKQIALMLGWTIAPLQFKLDWCMVPTEERLTKLNQDFVPFLIKDDEGKIRGKKVLFRDDTSFHDDWNWLHEAAEKVYSLLSHTDSIKHDIIQLLGRNQKEDVFIAVSNFAKIYNNKEL